MPALPASAPTARIKTRTRLKSSWLREAEPDFERRWPREESNLRARIRSPSLYPLSYGAVQRSVAAVLARSRRRNRRGGGLCPPRRRRTRSGLIRRKSCAAGATFVGRVADGTRTHDHLDHNQGLYQLSYSHHAQTQDSGAPLSRLFALPTCLRTNAASAGFRRRSPPCALRRTRTAGSHHAAAKPRRTSRGDAPGRIRTSDPRLRRPPLCPLSYRRRGKRVSRRRSSP